MKRCLWMFGLSLIPEDIYKFGRPNSKIPKSEDNINIGLKKNERNSTQLDMFFQEEKDTLREAYEFEVNFHNQLKAKILSAKIVTQIIRESKIAYENLLTDKQIEEEKKFDTAKAWNISNTLYYKLGGLPWKLGEIRDGVCYLGLVYKKTESDTKNKMLVVQLRCFLIQAMEWFLEGMWGHGGILLPENFIFHSKMLLR